MSGSLSLTPPFTNGPFGYRPPDYFGDRFRLRPPALSGTLGWVAQARNGLLAPIDLRLPSGVDDSFAAACAAVARGNPGLLDPKLAATQFQAAADAKLWDTLYGLLKDAGPNLWPDVPGTRRNIITGEWASIGKIDPSGVFRPAAPDDTVAGTALPIPAFSIGKRFAFVSDPEVHLYLYADKDAIKAGSKYLFSGGGIGLEGKTSGGSDIKLRLGGGRDEGGGAAGFITLHIGPDDLPQQPGP